MIQAKMYVDNGTFLRVKIEGHSGYSRRGSDIVCAAVSTISQGILGGIKDVLGCKVNILEDKDGELDFEVLPDWNELHHCQLLMRTLQYTLVDISESYPQFVSFKEEKVERSTICPS